MKSDVKAKKTKIVELKAAEIKAVVGGARPVAREMRKRVAVAEKK